MEPIKKKINELDLNICIQEAGSMFTLFFGKKKINHLNDALEIDFEMFVDFFQTLFKKGVYIPPSPYEAWFISAAHTEVHLIHTRNLIIEYLENINK